MYRTKFFLCFFFGFLLLLCVRCVIFWYLFWFCILKALLEIKAHFLWYIFFWRRYDVYGSYDVAFVRAIDSWNLLFFVIKVFCLRNLHRKITIKMMNIVCIFRLILCVVDRHPLSISSKIFEEKETHTLTNHPSSNKMWRIWLQTFLWSFVCARKFYANVKKKTEKKNKQNKNELTHWIAQVYRRWNIPLRNAQTHTNTLRETDGIKIRRKWYQTIA